MCRRTRQILAFFVGDTFTQRVDRSAESCRRLWERIPAAYRNRRKFSDFWEAYQIVLPEATHHPVGKESGETNHIERFNNTLRQRLGCLVRKALSFSKSWLWHEVRILLFLLRYNEEKRDEYLLLNPAG
jgi:insertion element IS1 protein InsB